MAKLGEDHHFVLFSTSAELFPRTLREALHQHVERLTLVFLVLLGRDLRLQLYQLVQTTDLLLLRHIVLQMLRGIGARTLRVLEHKGRVVPHLTHQLQ